MCGRYAYWDSDTIEEYYNCRTDFSVEKHYNVSPTQHVPVILAKINSISNNTHSTTHHQTAEISKVLEPMRWGLIPDWAKSDTHNGFINARSETIDQKKSFKENFLLRRCVVPARGFYEWNNKQPYFISLATEHMAFAAIWDGTNNGMFPSVAILTQESKALSHIHERMPISLETEADIYAWLYPTTRKEHLLKIIEKSSDAHYLAHEVSKDVSDPKKNRASLIDAL